ncbi:unnamed protein product [Amoebophrya sp. A25]|nr:unnamed protein product [Amoebophrya sp. A25]|eukprot:GSA25T00012973001.1
MTVKVRSSRTVIRFSLSANIGEQDTRTLHPFYRPLVMFLTCSPASLIPRTKIFLVAFGSMDTSRFPRYWKSARRGILVLTSYPPTPVRKRRKRNKVQARPRVPHRTERYIIPKGPGRPNGRQLRKGSSSST